MRKSYHESKFINHFIHCTTMRSTRLRLFSAKVSHEVHEYLKRNISADVKDQLRFHQSLVAHLEPVFGNDVTVAQLESFSGLEQLSQAVLRDFRDESDIFVPVQVRSGTTTTTELQFHASESLLDCIQKSQFAELLPATCDGNASCSTCHVYIENQETLSPVTEAEQDMLDLALGYDACTSRLSCQVTWNTPPEEPIRVTIPKEFNDLWN